MTDTDQEQTDTPPDPACPQCDGELEERPAFYHTVYWCAGCASHIDEP